MPLAWNGALLQAEDSLSTEKCFPAVDVHAGAARRGVRLARSISFDQLQHR